MAASDPSAPPSADPSANLSFAGALQHALKKTVQGMLDDCLPATVIAYDRTANRATVKPVIMMGTTEGAKISRAEVPSVPVLTLGGGNFILSFPIKPGDLGWLKATDRDISLFMQGLKEEWPNTTRSHSFSDGFFIPDIMRQWSLNAEDADRVVLQSLDGVSRIAIGDAIVKITTPHLEVDAASAHFTGTLTADGRVTGAGIALDTHHHLTGGPNTGPALA